MLQLEVGVIEEKALDELSEGIVELFKNIWKPLRNLRTICVLILKAKKNWNYDGEPILYIK